MPTRRTFLGVALPLAFTGTGCLGRYDQLIGEGSGCGFDEPVSRPPADERVTGYRVCAFVRDVSAGLTGTPLRLGVETVDDTATEGSPAVLEFSVTNTSGSTVELMTGAAPPFSTLRARGHDGDEAGRGSADGFVLWSDSYEESGHISMWRGGLMTNAIGIGLELAPGETRTQRYEIHPSVEGVSAGKYLVEASLGDTEVSFGVVLTPESTEAVDLASDADCSAGDELDGWPGFQRDPANTGHASEEELSDDFEVVRSHGVASSLRASPTVEDGVAFVSGRQGGLYAVARDGELWSVDGAFNENGCAVRDGTVFVSEGSAVTGEGVEAFLAAQSHHLRALDAEDGEEVWSFETESTGGVPTVAYDTVYLQDGSGYVYAVERSTGRLRWRAETEAGIEVGAPAVGDCSVYLGAEVERDEGEGEGGAVYGFDAADGGERWRYPVDGVPTAPTYADGVVYFGVNGTGELHAVDASDGEPIWSEVTRAGGNIVHCSPAVDGDSIYVGSYSGETSAPAQRLHVHDLDTGEEMWSAEASRFVWSSPAVAGDRVVFADLDGYVYLLDSSDGGLVDRVRPSDDLVRSSPAVVDGTVYLASEDGSVYLLESS